MKNIFLLTLAVFALVSCKLSQQYTFNADFSGKYQLLFDLNEMASYGVEDPDSIPNVFEDFNLDSVKQAYEQIKGLSHVNVSAAKNVLNVRYNFNDLDALNASLDVQNNGEFSLNNGSGIKFSNENGVFKYNFEEENAESTPDSIAEMMTFIDYDIVMEFAKPINSASNGIISESGNRLTLQGNLGEVAAKKKSLNVEVTFKK